MPSPRRQLFDYLATNAALVSNTRPIFGFAVHFSEGAQLSAMGLFLGKQKFELGHDEDREIIERETMLGVTIYCFAVKQDAKVRQESYDERAHAYERCYEILQWFYKLHQDNPTLGLTNGCHASISEVLYAPDAINGRAAESLSFVLKYQES